MHVLSGFLFNLNFYNLAIVSRSNSTTRHIIPIIPFLKAHFRLRLPLLELLIINYGENDKHLKQASQQVRAGQTIRIYSLLCKIHDLRKG